MLRMHARGRTARGQEERDLGRHAVTGAGRNGAAARVMVDERRGQWEGAALTYAEAAAEIDHVTATATPIAAAAATPVSCVARGAARVAAVLAVMARSRDKP